MTNLARTFIWQDEQTGEISISAYSVDHPEYEMNHITLVELRGAKVNKHSSVLNILENVLRDCNVQVIRE